MPDTANGFVRDNSQFTGTLVWTDDRDANVKITVAHHDYHDQDIANALNNRLRLDGINSLPTANISWGGKKIVSLANGSAATDAAAYGQTITAASLNAGNNVLTLTRAAGDVTVDLSALAVGGSTSDFARYSNALNPFQGSATFEGTLGALYGLSLVDQITVTGSYTWSFSAATPALAQIANTAGAAFNFSGNSGTAKITVNGAEVWTTDTLPASTFTGFLTASANATITGAWTFTNPNCKLVPFQWAPGTGTGNWSVGPDSTTQLSFTTPGGVALVFVEDSSPAAGAWLQIGTQRAWDHGSLKSGLTTAPTGGENGDLAVVQSGADRGLWTKISGTWTKLIAFP